MAQLGTIAFTSFPESGVTAGQPVTITWEGGDSTAVRDVSQHMELDSNVLTSLSRLP
jgi:hypothetical protein